MACLGEFRGRVGWEDRYRPVSCIGTVYQCLGTVLVRCIGTVYRGKWGKWGEWGKWGDGPGNTNCLQTIPELPGPVGR